MNQEYWYKFVLENSGNYPISLIIEPWAYEKEMMPNEKLLIEICGNEPVISENKLDCMGIFYLTDRIEIWGWGGSLVRVTRPGGSIIVEY